MLDFMRAGGFNMGILAILAIPALWTAVRFARNADPHRLSILRALTLAIVFATITGFITSIVATCRHVATDPDMLKEPLVYLLLGVAESCANLILGGGIVTLTWILIAVGVRRMPNQFDK